jgi:hypothetical protein
MTYRLVHSAARRSWLALICAAFLMASCDYLGSEPFKTEKEVEREKRGSITGPGGIASWFGDAPAQPDGAALGVNVFLWRASLDTVSIWPVTSADPFGGIILTDWYAPPQTPNERLKLNVYIVDRTLRADGVRVAVFRQVRDANGQWQNAAVQPETAARLEEAILMRARQMRNQTAQGT